MLKKPGEMLEFGESRKAGILQVVNLYNVKPSVGLPSRLEKVSGKRDEYVLQPEVNLRHPSYTGDEARKRGNPPLWLIQTQLMWDQDQNGLLYTMLNLHTTTFKGLKRVLYFGNVSVLVPVPHQFCLIRP